MLLAENIFGKSFDSITLSDLQDYFTEERSETHNLEFKSGDVRISDLYKEICAFLNADGGVLIVGTPQEKKVSYSNETRRVCQGSLISSKLKGKTWIEQHIAAHIIPFPQGIDIKELHDKSGGSYYILDIPKSIYAPHQFKSDGRYYIRLEDEAHPAPNAAVRALFLKNEKPDLSITFNFENNVIAENRLLLNIVIKNDSNVTPETLNYNICIINVEEVNSNLLKFDSSFGNSQFTCQNTYKDPILNELSFQLPMNLTHKFQPFLVYAMGWGRPSGFIKRGVIYDPSNHLRLVDTFDTYTTYPDLESLKKQLNDITDLL